MKKIIITVSLVFLLTIAGYSQRNFFAVDWEVNFPNNSDYISKTSFAGGKLDYRHFIKNTNISAGIALSWATYEEYLPRQTFQKPDGGAVTGDFVAQAYQLPMVATVHYYFKESKLFRPFVGVGLGAQYLEQSLYYNVYVSEDNNWGFVARPEIGAIIKPSESKYWGILFGAHYSYATNKTELLDNNSFKNFGLSLGIVFQQ